jgi:hypothetical protein
MQNPDREGRGLIEWFGIAVAVLAFLALGWAFGRWALGIW